MRAYFGLIVVLSFAIGYRIASAQAGAAITSASPAGSPQWTVWQQSPCQSKHPGKVPGRLRDKTAFFAYELQRTTAKAQPFILVPRDNNDTAVVYGGEELVVQIHASADAVKAVPFLSVDISATAATALNPTPVRGTIGASPAAAKSVVASRIEQDGYACSYAQLAGDTVPSIAVNVFTVDAEKPIQVMQTNLQQVHKLVYFNIATGVVASTIRDSTFSRVIGSPASGGTAATFKTVQQKGDPRIVPALFFTSYLFHKIDPEAPFEKWDIVPQPSIGFSLTSPSSDFFFGGASEFFVRNVQLVYGFHYGQTTHLVPNQVNDPTSKDAQATQKSFDRGAYVGLTFNIDFIKGLFGGGK